MNMNEKMNENNENLKECEILGYQQCTVKDSQEEMLRICMAIKSSREKFIGKESVYIFLPYSKFLETKLNDYVLGNPQNKTAYYRTTDNIITGKTKVSEIVIR